MKHVGDELYVINTFYMCVFVGLIVQIETFF